MKWNTNKLEGGEMQPMQITGLSVQHTGARHTSVSGETNWNSWPRMFKFFQRICKDIHLWLFRINYGMRATSNAVVRKLVLNAT